MSSWDLFKAFNGKLDSSFLQPVLNAQTEVDIEATLASFEQWISNLRQSPADFGIAQDRTEVVRKVLDFFFPEPTKGQPLLAQRISSVGGNPASLRKIVPIQVPFGPNDSQVLIADAPNALGYVFSLAAPVTEGQTQFASDLLPLAVCYAWATYLAFLRPSSVQGPVITNVPADVCLIYLPGAASVSSFCLGSAWSGVNPPDAYGAGRNEDDTDQMDRWRRDAMIEPLRSLYPSFSLPKQSPYVHRLATRRLNEYILGVPGNDAALTPFLEPLFNGVIPKLPGLGDVTTFSNYIQVVSAVVKTDNLQPLGISTEPDFLISHARLGPTLTNLLGAVLDTMDQLTEALDLIQNLQKLIQFYVTPHVFDPLTGVELPLGQYSKPIVDALATTLPLALLPNLKKKLHSLSCHLHNIHESENAEAWPVEVDYFIRDTRGYGRSPEAFPLYALSRDQGVHQDPFTKNGLSSARGVRLCTQALGQSILSGCFRDSLSADKLDQASTQDVDGQQVKDPILGLPDSEARVLINMVQNQQSETLGSYSDDVKAVCPKTFTLVSGA